MNTDMYRTMKASGTLPKEGDTVQLAGHGANGVGRVVATFYENGQGGMHVKYPNSCSWTCCTDVTVLVRS